MERNDIINDIKNKNKVLLELPTSYGKTKLAIDYLLANNNTKPLILTPSLVIENGWINDQLPKWDPEHKLSPIFMQYASFINTDKVRYLDFDSVVCDEGHHITEKCLNTISVLSSKFKYKNTIVLSATVSNEKRELLYNAFGNLYTVRVSTAKAIDEEQLPVPTMVFVKCKLNSVDTAIYQTMADTLDHLKQYSSNKVYEIRMKRQAKDIYEWLSCKKEDITKKLLNIYAHYKTLTFCSNISQCNNLGFNPIHSKNKESTRLINDFNNCKIKHLTSCRVLLEGVNLYGCRVGIFNYLSPTLRIQVQSIGRLMRHKKPILIFPYFMDTRDEIIVNKIFRQYKKSAKIIVTNEYKIEEAHNECKTRRTRKSIV